MTERETARRVAIRLGAGGKLYCPDWVGDLRSIRPDLQLAPRTRLIVRVPPGIVGPSTVFRLRYHGSISGRSISRERALHNTDYAYASVYRVARRMVEEALGREL